MNEQGESIRLNKYLAGQLGLSRRAADSLIEQGRILINDKAVELGGRITPATDKLTIDGEAINTKVQSKKVYLLFNKPVGYICSRRMQGDTPTIYSRLPEQYRDLKPVGRLDKDSSGLLLLTNDGDFAHRMTHPSFKKAKTYEVKIDTPLEPLHRQMISDHGVMLDDGPSKLQLERLHEGDETQWIVHMHEGRNRQIRRTFASLGYQVTRLHRTTFGPYTLDLLKPGRIKETSAR